MKEAPLVALGLAAALVLGAAAAWFLVREERGSIPDLTESTVPPSAPSTGSIAGVVTWAGPAPRSRSHPVTTDHAACGVEVPAEELLIGSNGELQNALVSLERVAGGASFPPSPSPLALDIAACLFRERITVVPAGATIDVRNGDRILHYANFNSFRNPARNFAIPAGGRTNYPVRALEKIKVTCNLHPWMAAYVIVRDNPYHSVTAPDGRFVIRDVPPGRHVLHVWHELVGKRAVDVDVSAGLEVRLDLEVAPK